MTTRNEDETTGDVVKRVEFRVSGTTGVVPVVMWLPRHVRKPAVCLLGHGGSTSKTSLRNERLAVALARRGIAALAIDGPFHGDRVAAPVPAAEYQRLMIERGVPAVIESMVVDWQDALNSASGDERVDINRCGYIGLSLGSRFGIPVAASLGNRLRCAVFGKFGMEQSDHLPTGLAVPEIIDAAARRLAAPLLLHIQRDDELFPLAGSLALFDTFGSSDKTLMIRPGAHATTHPRDEQDWLEFITDGLSR